MPKKKYTKEDLKDAYRHGAGNAVATEAGLEGWVTFDEWFKIFSNKRKDK
jgi:hypothetical protein